MLGFLIGGLALIPVAYVYGRLTERMPDAGSEIAYTGAVFPQGVSFATGWMMTLAYLIVGEVRLGWRFVRRVALNLKATP